MNSELDEWLRYASDDVKELNQDVFMAKKTKPKSGKYSKRGTEGKFVLYWNKLGGPKFVREFRFHPVRRWRFDFAWPKAKPPVAVEIEGGQWMRGRHNRPEGYAKDAEKYNTATSMGWRVFRLTPAMIDEDSLKMIIRSITGS